MKKLSIFLVLSTLAVFLVAGNAQALPKIDGIFNLTEWAGYYVNDDGVKNTDNGYVDPGYGGQAFDVEYLGLIVTDDMVYFGLQTGFDFGRTDYKPGDFALDVNGGGYDWAIDFSISGNTVTYKLVDMSTIDGDTYWDGATSFGASNPFQALYTEDDVVSTFTGVYQIAKDLSNNVDGGYSYTIEGAFQRSLLVSNYDGGLIKEHWTMSCGNDAGDLTSAPVPEPTTILLSGIGLLGMGLFLRRKTRPSV